MFGLLKVALPMLLKVTVSVVELLVVLGAAPPTQEEPVL
jgi:hypothetical protein